MKQQLRISNYDAICIVLSLRHQTSYAGMNGGHIFNILLVDIYISNQHQFQVYDSKALHLG